MDLQLGKYIILLQKLKSLYMKQKMTANGNAMKQCQAQHKKLRNMERKL
jgi:hypothetical protein